MGIISRIRHRLESLGLVTPAPDRTAAEEMSFSAEIPVAGSTEPLWKFRL